MLKRYGFNEEHNLFREAFRAFVERELVPNIKAWRKQGHVSREVWRKAGEAGFLALRAPEAFGGLNLQDFRYEQIMLEEQCRYGDTGMALYLHNTIVFPYLNKFATDVAKDRYLPGTISGERILGIAMTEPGGGSDVGGIRTTARREGEHYVLNGSKVFISNGVIGNLFVVAARTDTDTPRSLSLFLVEDRFEGFRRGRCLKKMGYHAQDTAELFFDDVVVPAENLLGEEGQGFKYLMHGLSEERLICAVESLGLAECAFDLTLDYVKERHVFGRAVSTYQNTQFVLAQLRAKMDMAQAYLDTLVGHVNRGDDESVGAAQAKLLCSELHGEVVDQCLQFFGGNGYMDEYEISHMYTDARRTRIVGGTSEIMKLIIGRSLELDGLA